MKDDPSKPYKMIAAIISAFLTSFIATNATDMPAWAIGLVTAAVAAIAVYLTPNPKVADTVVPPV
jgi:mono/diheme cytochrome c family protein